MICWNRYVSSGCAAATLLFSTLLGLGIGGNVAANEIPRVGDVAPDFTLETLDGGHVELSEVASKGKVVLVVLRGYPGYQCPVCTAQVAGLMNKARQLSAAESRVILVYPGPAESLKAHADEFVAGKRLPENFDLVLDPDYAFTKAYGLRWDAPDETAYPSTFVMDQERRIQFAKVSRTHGDRAKVEEILKSLE